MKRDGTEKDALISKLKLVEINDLSGKNIMFLGLLIV